jgi:anti-sigma factor RsiW
MKHWFMWRRGRRTEMLDCHEVAEVLQRYLDDLVDARQVRLIEAHLEDCRRCGMELETYRYIKSTLAAHREQVPAESVQRLREFGERLAGGEQLPQG